MWFLTWVVEKELDFPGRRGGRKAWRCLEKGQKFCVAKVTRDGSF